MPGFGVFAMPRRNKRESYEPLDLTPADVEATPPLTREELAEQRRARAKRQHDARVNGGIDWTACLVPGCGGRVFTQGSGIRDHAVELPMCLDHLLVAAKLAQAADGKELIAASARLLARHEAAVATRDEQRRREHLARIDGHIYFIRLNGLIKVGWSRRIADRIHSYGPEVEVLAVYPATRNDETNLHRQLKPARARGREWYEDGAVLARFITEALATHGPPPQFDTWSKAKEIVGAKRHR